MGHPLTSAFTARNLCREADPRKTLQPGRRRYKIHEDQAVSVIGGPGDQCELTVFRAPHDFHRQRSAAVAADCRSVRNAARVLSLGAIRNTHEDTFAPGAALPPPSPIRRCG